MFSEIKDQLEIIKQTISNRWHIWKSTRVLRHLGLEITDTDEAARCLAFRLNENIVAIFITDDSTLGNRIEISVIFDAMVVNLRLMSDLANIALAHKCSLSGLSHAKDGTCKVELAYYLGSKIGLKEVEIAITYMEACIKQVMDTILGKIDSVNSFSWDLSMFDTEDLRVFNPQQIGEIKEYMYGDWPDYLEEAGKLTSIPYHMVEPTFDINILLACQKFETVNKVQLVDMGNVLFGELVKMAEVKNPDIEKHFIN